MSESTVLAPPNGSKPEAPAKLGVQSVPKHGRGRTVPADRVEAKADEDGAPFTADDVRDFGPAIVLERFTVTGEGFQNPNGSGAASGYLTTTKESDCLQVVYFPRVQAVRIRLDMKKYGKNVRHREVWVPFSRAKWGNLPDVFPE